jgi:hypothetical protein
MGLALIIIGLLVWFLLGAVVIGIVLVVIGIVLIFVPGAPYGYSHYRRPPP